VVRHPAYGKRTLCVDHAQKLLRRSHTAGRRAGSCSGASIPDAEDGRNARAGSEATEQERREARSADRPRSGAEGFL